MSALTNLEIRLRLNRVIENINDFIPRHSQSPHQAFQFVVRHLAETNEDQPAPVYKFDVQVTTDDVTECVLYDGNSVYLGEKTAPNVSSTSRKFSLNTSKYFFKIISDHSR